MNEEPLPHERVPGAYEEWRYDIVNNPRAVLRLQAEEAYLNTNRVPERQGGGRGSSSPVRELTAAEIAEREKARMAHEASCGVSQMRREILREYLVERGLDMDAAYEDLIRGERAWIQSHENSPDPIRRAYVAYMKKYPLEGNDAGYVLSTGGRLWREKVQKEIEKAKRSRERQSARPNTGPASPRRPNPPTSGKPTPATRPGLTPRRTRPFWAFFVPLLIGILGWVGIIWAIRWLFLFFQ